MRTTIRLDDELWLAVKTRAAEARRSMSAVIEDSIRAGLAAQDEIEAQGPPRLRPFPVFARTKQGRLRIGGAPPARER